MAASPVAAASRPRPVTTAPAATASIGAAVIICPALADPRRRVLGLEIGERLLLALGHAGIGTVCFVGPGERPACSRAGLQELEADGLDPAQRHVVLASDTIFDHSLLREPRLPADVAMRFQDGEALRRTLDDLPAALEALGLGQARAGRGFAIRIASKRAARQAERALLLSLRKPIDGFISTHLNRYVSLFCTRFLVKTGLPPNLFTILFMAIGLAAAIFATQAEYAWALVAAGLLFQAQSILDGCDGEMARLTYQFSRRGQWLDSIGDDLTNYAVCLGLAIGQARVLDQPSLYWLGGAVLLLHLVTSGVLYRRMLVMGTGDLLAIPDLVRTQRPKGILGAISDAINLALKRDSFIFILAVIIVFQQPLFAFYLYAFGTVPMTVGVLLNDYRIARHESAAASG